MPDVAAEISARYEQDAAAYERLWAPVLKPLSVPMLDALPLPQARRVLDIGAGPGLLLDEIAARAPSAYIVGSDLTHGMVRRAPASYGRCVADARAQAFRDGVFDVALTTFVFQHVPDPPVALAATRRILRDGGVFGMLTWHEPIPDYHALVVLNELLDELGAAPQQSLARTGDVEDPDRLTALLEGAGFTIERRWLDEQDYVMTPEGFLDRVSNLGPAKRRMQSLERLDLEAVRSRLSALPAASFVEPLAMIYTVARA